MIQYLAGPLGGGTVNALLGRNPRSVWTQGGMPLPGAEVDISAIGCVNAQGRIRLQSVKITCPSLLEQLDHQDTKGIDITGFSCLSCQTNLKRQAKRQKAGFSCSPVSDAAELMIV